MLGRELRAPDIIDFEVLSAIRRLTLQGKLDVLGGAASLADFGRMVVNRVPSGPLLGRAFELRRTVSAGDALYVALAERLQCPLVTTDGRLARSHGHEARIELIG